MGHRPLGAEQKKLEVSTSQLERISDHASLLDILDVLAGEAGGFLECLAFSIGKAGNLSQAMYLIGAVPSDYQP
jgi:hypothetical protein